MLSNNKLAAYEDKNKVSCDLLTQVEEKLKEKDEKWLYIAYEALAFNDPELTRRAGSAVGGLLKDYDMGSMLRLSETFRQYTSMEWRHDWSKVRPAVFRKWLASEEDYRYAIILGSFHSNGYYREKCLCEMEACKGTLAFIILRMNDWVEAIRRRAVSAAWRRIRDSAVGELLYAAPALDKIRRSCRREEEAYEGTVRLLEARLEQEAGNITPRGMLRLEFGIRKSAYRFLFSGQILELEKAEQLLRKEKHSICQLLIITGILRHYDCPIEQADRYLEYKSAAVRRKVLEYKYSLVKNSWPGLKAMLLDSNRGIREYTAYILERHENFDTLGFYLARLDDKDPAVSIAEIGIRGGREQKELLMPFLEHPEEKVVRCAITAVGRLAGSEMDDIFWRFLSDRRQTVSKAAYHAAVYNRISYGAAVLYDAICRADAAWRKRYFVGLLVREKSWERLPYLIHLYSDPAVEELRDIILRSLHGRYLYCRITQVQGQAVLRALEECGGCLPPGLAEAIRFDLKFVMAR